MNRRIFVLGMGSSGLAAAKKMKEMGNDVFVSEAEPENNVQSAIQQLLTLNIPFETGGHDEQIAGQCDMIVKSPGIPQNIPLLLNMRQKGIPIYSEIEVGSWYCRAPIIGITGTNGKSTTTTLVGELLKRKFAGVFVGGNLGIPFTACPDMPDQDVFVLEISSYQLENIEKFKPRVAVILNITPDHLNRHGTMDRYIAAKKRLLENQTAQDIVIYNNDDPLVVEITRDAKAHKVPFGLQNTNHVDLLIQDGILLHQKNKIIDLAQTPLAGLHNHYNIMAAVLCALYFDVAVQNIQSVLQSFQTLEHRIEYIGDLNGVQFYNDSKATNSASTIAALDRFEKPVVLLAGGMAKEDSFIHMRKLMRQKVKKVMLFGSSGKKIMSDLSPAVNVELYSTMKEALQAAIKIAETGDVILLSPMCASHDQFDNYIQRGIIFKQLVQNYIRQGKVR
ncbi:UDP-N-acetylmuramoyl-L-alanine--D-glutamate ligase [candidate division KSB1 bacterium]|nr:UDP-N-acetylmuramoyl-L-alanine--D-glutamate ligase [candidate division KSB1 bacterium]